MSDSKRRPDLQAPQALQSAEAFDPGDLFDGPEVKHHTKRVGDPDSVTQIGKPKKPEPQGIAAHFVDRWDHLTDVVRNYSPASVVNHGTKIVFALRAIADGMSVYSGLQYSSKPRAAASLISLGGLCLGLVFDEDPISPEERESYSRMGYSEYIPLRLKQAFDPVHHVTSTVGLATIPNGVLMAISGARQRVPGKTPWELYQGLMTIAAGASMNFIPDQERAMQTAAGIFTIRSPFAFMQATKAWKVGVPEKGVPAGDIGQMGKFVFNQASNIAGFFYAGVEKMPDGRILTIEEADAERDMAKAQAERAKNTPEKTLEPANDTRDGAAVTVAAPTAKVLTETLSSKRVAEAPVLAHSTNKA